MLLYIRGRSEPEKGQQFVNKGLDYSGNDRAMCHFVEAAPCKTLSAFYVALFPINMIKVLYIRENGPRK